MCVWTGFGQLMTGYTLLFFREYSMLSIESWKLCDQLIDYQLSKTRSALRNPLHSVISITFTYISARKRCKKRKSEKYIDRIKQISSIESFQKQPTVDNISKYTAVWRGVYGSRSTGCFLYQLTAKANTLGPATQASAKKHLCCFYSSVCMLRVHHLTEENIQTHFVTSLQIQSLERIHRLFQHRNTTHTDGSYVRNAM